MKVMVIVVTVMWLWSVMTVLGFFGVMWLFANTSDLIGAIGLVTFAVIEAVGMLYVTSEGFTESPVRRSGR